VSVVSSPAYENTAVQARMSAQKIAKLKGTMQMAVNAAVARAENGNSESLKKMLSKESMRSIKRRLARAMPSSVTLADYRASGSGLCFEQWFEQLTGHKILPHVSMAVRRALRAAPKTDEER